MTRARSSSSMRWRAMDITGDTGDAGDAWLWPRRGVRRSCFRPACRQRWVTSGMKGETPRSCHGPTEAAATVPATQGMRGIVPRAHLLSRTLSPGP